MSRVTLPSDEKHASWIGAMYLEPGCVCRDFCRTSNKESSARTAELLFFGCHLVVIICTRPPSLSPHSTYFFASLQIRQNFPRVTIVWEFLIRGGPLFQSLCRWGGIEMPSPNPAMRGLK